MSTGTLRAKAKTAVLNPRLVCREINSVAHRTVPRWNYATRGTDFLAADWDNLLILDACRYDLFESENWIPGHLERRTSKASSTVGFLRTNVDGADLRDTVYVTANGQLHHYEDEIDATFHDVVPLYADAWDDELGTVPPDAVAAAALDAASKYPNKRLLVHFVQPHFPFIGSDTSADKNRVNEAAYERAFWRRVFDGDVDMDRSEIWEAYAATLRLALDHVQQVVDRVDGKSVVTSDHGNMIGERGHPIPIREWGHPDGLFYRELVEVPWLETEWETRRRIVPEPPREYGLKSDPAVVADRLESLGYK